VSQSKDPENTSNEKVDPKQTQPSASSEEVSLLKALPIIMNEKEKPMIKQPMTTTVKTELKQDEVKRVRI
jgi:hypothetical protein